MDTPTPQPSFLTGANTAFVSELHARYLKDPGSIDPQWASFFAELGDDPTAVLQDVAGPSWAPKANRSYATVSETQEGEPAAVAADAISDEATRKATMASIRALMLIRTYRVRGHLMANLDPLGMEDRSYHPELDPANYGFTQEDMDTPIFINNVLGRETATLREIIDILQQTYCGSIGVEFMHIQDPEQKAWIQDRIEGTQNRPEFTQMGKKAILSSITQSEAFEQFLDKKYTGTKRFGLDGGETAVPALEQILKKGGQLGIKEIIIGMPHRGRLNMLANVMAKPATAIFSEFQGSSSNPEDVQGSGDVKYHLGTSSDRDFNGTMMHLSLTANPSHLEAVNPVVLGKARAKQTQRIEKSGTLGARREIMGLLLHGDAAFAGQGLVPETFDLSELRGYRTGGTIHFIVNNQIGFTTSPTFSRSSPYCSDVAKGVQAPIFHVNGDDPEAVVNVARIAIEFRQQFLEDAVIDMFCYRRFGHNEGDEPKFTQPLMYAKIAGLPSTREIYARQLIGEGVITEQESDDMKAEAQTALEKAFEAATNYKPNKADWLEGSWAGMRTAHGDARRGDTAVPAKELKKIGNKLTQYPGDFNVHPKILRLFENKRKMLKTGEGVDWAMAEAMAFGSLLVEGNPVRLSGQDSGRGTFSHRHSVLIDQETEDRFIPLNNIMKKQAAFEVIDSPLSEAAVLGYEYGYSLAEPNALVMWEAQFGDFANGAQVIIDQFISSGESKWLRMSGLTMLLPHGFEGQGPEHSSARMERYLQLCAEDNIQVANCTAPANFFHILRRQVKRPFRKPLVIFTPKSLLRHKMCISPFEDFTEDSSFHRVLWDRHAMCKDKDVKRVILCTGKVYYDLVDKRENIKARNAYILRVEQLYPFPSKSLTRELARFPNADVVWCQEEPKNMGSWTFVEPFIEEVMSNLNLSQRRPIYVGRPAAASPATGLHRRHVAEQMKLTEEALDY